MGAGLGDGRPMNVGCNYITTAERVNESRRVGVLFRDQDSACAGWSNDPADYQTTPLSPTGTGDPTHWICPMRDIDIRLALRMQAFAEAHHGGQIVLGPMDLVLRAHGLQVIE